MILEALAAFIALTNPTTCATIDNSTNTATWTHGRKVATAYYEDTGEEQLRFSRKVPVQVRQAEEALQYGQPRQRVITVCSSG